MAEGKSKSKNPKIIQNVFWGILKFLERTFFIHYRKPVILSLRFQKKRIGIMGLPEKNTG
jgi:hypothetical protein